MTDASRPSTPSPDWDRIGRYLAGEATTDEAADVRRWLDQHPREARAIAALDSAARTLSPDRAIDVEAALRRVKAQRESRATSRPRLIAALAAAAMIMIAAGIQFVRSRGMPPAATREYATAPGARDSIAISDRTSAVLAPNSRLVASSAEATLSGRAYFIVAHDAAHPFTVHAGSITVRDVGTRFVVDNAGDSSVRVVVADGSVDVALGTTRERLNGGDVATAQGSRVIVSRGAATSDDLAWTRGELVFRDAPLPSVAADLHRWYGVDLQVRDSSLTHRHFTGTFTNEPVNRVLDVISLALGARVERRGDTAFIESARSPK